MKNLFLKLSVFVLGLMIFLPNVLAKGKAVYMFSMNGCHNCAAIEDYFSSVLKDDPDLFQFYNIEVVNAAGKFVESPRQLMATTLERFDLEVKYEFPLIVIGDFYQVGAYDQENLLTKIKEYNESSVSDGVKKDAEELNIELEQYLYGKEDNEESGKYDIIILVSIFVILIGGFAGLVFIGRK